MEERELQRIVCPICKGSNVDKHPAVISAFLSVRCGFPESTTTTNFCRPCNFVYFERGLSDIEASKLYSGYRGPEYNEMRLSVEPSYTHYIPMFDDKFSGYWVGRTNELLDICRESKLLSCNSILDFGGDGMIPGRIFPASNIVVDDLSIPTSGGTQASRFDLIMASEVFEHLNNPAEVLMGLTERMNHNGRILIDVPAEYVGSLKQAWDHQKLIGGSLMVMHEHINHFSIEAMASLLKTAGLVPTKLMMSPLNFIVAVAEKARD
jgi:hypothetical protein